jgi:hypothetical protein
MAIRLCRDDERDDILSVINAAAEVYRGVIPADRWHEPYMLDDELDRECAAGVVFWGYEDRGRLAGVTGLQAVRDGPAGEATRRRRRQAANASAADQHDADAGRYLGCRHLGDPLL